MNDDTTTRNCNSIVDTHTRARTEQKKKLLSNELKLSNHHVRLATYRARDLIINDYLRRVMFIIESRESLCVRPPVAVRRVLICI